MRIKLAFTLICFTAIFPIKLSAQQFEGNQNYTKDSIISSLIVHVNEDSVNSFIQSLENFGTRFMLAPNRQEVAFWIMDKFISFGIEDVRIDSVLCTIQIDLWNLHYDTTTWQYNVMATIPGTDNQDEYMVIGAHYDDVVSPEGDPMILAPGADDNASGVAALFEIARIFSKYNYHPKNSIEFVAFAAEELMNYGNSGSEGYVNQAINNEMNIQLMINNDMIANTNSTNWKIKVSNYINCEWLTNMSVDVIQNYTQIEPIILAPSNTGSADCRYFYQAGIPCVYFMEKDFNGFYHSEDDLLFNCETDYCSEAIKISLGVLITADNQITLVEETGSLPLINLYPNPFHDKINIKIASSLKSDVLVGIYSLDGKQINLIKLESEFGSDFKFTWNGKDKAGQAVPKGFYYLTASFGNQIIKEKIVKF